MSRFLSKAAVRSLISMGLIIVWVLGCANASNRISQNRYAMEIAGCRANKAYDILEEKLVKETRLFLSDSFFIKGKLLFALFGKSKLNVYEVKK